MFTRAISLPCVFICGCVFFFTFLASLACLMYASPRGMAYTKQNPQKHKCAWAMPVEEQPVARARLLVPRSLCRSPCTQSTAPCCPAGGHSFAFRGTELSPCRSLGTLPPARCRRGTIPCLQCALGLGRAVLWAPRTSQHPGALPGPPRALALHWGHSLTPGFLSD